MNLRICSVMQQVKQVTLYKRSGEVKQHSKVKWLIIFNLHSEQLEWCASFVSILQCVYVCVHCMIMCMQLWGVGSCEHQLMLLVVFRFCSCIVTQGYIQNKLSKGNTCQLSYSNTKLNSIFFLCLQKDGVLTAEMVSSCASNLGRFSTGLQHFYHHLSLPVRHVHTHSICK